MRAKGLSPLRFQTSRRMASGGLVAVHQHQLVGGLQPHLLVLFQCFFNDLHFSTRHPVKVLRIEDRLPGAVRAARIHRVRGIAEQRDAPPRPVRQRVAVHHRVLEHLLGVADQRRAVEPVEVPVLEGRVEILDPAAEVPVLHHVARRLDFGHPVDELAARGVQFAADRVDHHLADFQPACHRHAGAGQERLRARHAAPHVDALVRGRTFAWKELLAHGGMDAVAADGAAARRRSCRLRI